MAKDYQGLRDQIIGIFYSASAKDQQHKTNASQANAKMFLAPPAGHELEAGPDGLAIPRSDHDLEVIVFRTTDGYTAALTIVREPVVISTASPSALGALDELLNATADVLVEFLPDVSVVILYQNTRLC